MNSFEQVGRFFGEHVGKRALDYAREKVEQFEVEVSGIENLSGLEGRPYLLASNHVKPEGKFQQEIGLGPDALVLERLVSEHTGRQLRIIAKSDNGWWSENLYRYFQKYIQEPLGQGFVEGTGFVPIKKNPGSFNRDFVKAVEQIVAEGEPILIFPEGDWQDTFDPERKLEPGVASIALKHHLPIVPSYIDGGRTWKPGERVKVAFGRCFETTDQETKEEITQRISHELTELQKLTVPSEAEVTDES